MEQLVTRDIKERGNFLGTIGLGTRAFNLNFIFFFFHSSKAEIYGGSRGRAPREKLLIHVAVILIRLPSSIASGFGGLFTFFAFSRNGYFKIESRPDARLTLPKAKLNSLRGRLCFKSHVVRPMSAIRSKTTPTRVVPSFLK